MSKLKLILLSIISVLIISTQANEIDSLKKELKSGDVLQRLSALEKLVGARSVPAKERIDFSKRAILASQKLKNVESEAFSRLCLGIAYADVRDYIKAIQSLHNSITLYESIDDKMGISKVLTILGRTYFYLKNLDESAKYFEEALQIRVELGDEREISRALINVGNIQATTGNFKEAMKSFKKVLKIEEKYNNLVLISQCYNNIANIHLALGELDKVLPYRFKALEIDRKLQDDWQIAIKTYNLAEYYLINNEAEKAYPYIIESKKLAEKLDDKELMNDNVEFLSWYYKLMNDYPKALEYLDQYSKSNNEIFSKELSDKVGEMNVLYETEKKELEKQTILLKLEQSKKDKGILLFSLIIILIVCSFLIYLYYRKRTFNRLLKSEVLLQTNSLSNKNKELLESAILLKIAKDKAEESNRLKSAFLSNMSHEIRTPMNSIMGFANLLKEPDLSGDKQQKYISFIEKGGDRMLNIINNIVNMSIIEAGQLETRIQELDVNNQLEYIYSFFKSEVEKKGLKFNLNYALDSREVIIKTDKDKVESVLTNLVNNAIKYTDNGLIEFGCVEKAASLEFYVKDSGIGILEERQEAIFERFIQADIVDKMARQGAGLGLSISKAYVEILGGRIWVDSKIGKGSTFYFTIPFNKEITKKGKVIESKKIENKYKILINKTILVVDDDDSSYEYLKVILNGFGIYNMVWAKNGKEAFSCCTGDSTIDLVLMDINMPVMNGFIATKEIKKIKPNLPIIAQTAYAIAGDREKFIDAGCDDYISKPIKKDELIEVINKFLS